MVWCYIWIAHPELPVKVESCVDQSLSLSGDLQLSTTSDLSTSQVLVRICGTKQIFIIAAIQATVLKPFKSSTLTY